MKRGFGRFIIAMCILLVCLGVVFMKDNFGAFRVQCLGGTPIDYNTEVDSSKMKDDTPVEGTVYQVIDLMMYEYTVDEDTNKETTSSYYYLLPFSDDELLLVEAKSNTAFDDDITDLMYACHEHLNLFSLLYDMEYYGDDPKKLMEAGVELSGIMETNDSDTIDFYNDWLDEYGFILSDYGYDEDTVKLLPCTLNCKSSVSECATQFIIGLVCMIIFLVIVGIAIAVFVSHNKKPKAQAYAGAPMNYNSTPGFGTNNTNNSFIPTASTPQNYNPTATYNSQNSSQTLDVSAQQFQQQNQQNDYNTANTAIPSSNFGFGAGTGSSNNNGFGQ